MDNLLPMAFHHKDKNYQVYVTATCFCGKRWIVRKTSIITGKTTVCSSCAGRAAQTKHGDSMHRPPTYITWRSMYARCKYPKSSNYKNYGGRGIKICKRWSNYTLFRADMGERPAGKTIDRINPNGNYEPKNCRWATAKEQIANRRAINRS